MKKILFPTDFSDCAAHAFRYVQELASGLGATVDLLHVFHLPIGDASSVPPEYIQEMLDDMEAKALEELDSFCADYAGRPTLGSRRAVYGLFTPVEITDHAQEGGYDLIAMGTKGERGALEKMMGSVTTDVMMKAACPVLAIPGDAEYRPVGHIAYATDFEPTEEHAVGELMTLAAKLGAQVHFAHVNTGSKGGVIEQVATEKEYPYHFTDFSVINNPSVLDGLDDYIRQRQIDWLAVYIPRRRLWERLFHSSFTKKMTFHTGIPLLVFHG